MSETEFELASGNIVLGRFTWLFIRVPEGWIVKLGDASADVNYTTVVQNMGWVLDGIASFYVINLVNGTLLELEIKCMKGVKTPSEKTIQEKIIINGHEAYLSTKTVRRGLKRRPHLQTKVKIPCNVTDRTIELTLTAENSKDIEEHMKCFPRYRCH